MAAKIDTLEIKGVKIPVIFEKDTRLPIATTQVVFTNSGSISDTNLAGVAKLSARMLGEGTKTLGADKFADKLESKAIHISANAGKETFVIEVSSLKEQYEESLEDLSELLQDPNYTQEALQKVKTTTMGALSRKENDFDYIASSELKKLMFDGTVLAQPADGTVTSVQKIELSHIKNFVENHLVLSRVIIVVGGDLKLSEVKKSMKKVLSHLPVGTSEPLDHFEVDANPKEKILYKETQQAYIYFGSPYNMAVDDEEYYKARVATYILGTGGFGCRLMEEIRVKRGLAYSAYARVHVGKSASYLTGYLQTKLESSKEAQETVKAVFEKFVKEGATKEELEQTKKFLLGSEPLRVETMSQRLSRTFMDYYKGYELDHSQRELEKIRKLKLKDLNSYIKKHKEILLLHFAIVTKKI